MHEDEGIFNHHAISEWIFGSIPSDRSRLAKDGAGDITGCSLEVDDCLLETLLPLPAERFK